MTNNTQITTNVININRGIFQGNSLSPLLFCIGYFFVSYKVRKLHCGYIPGPPRRRDASKMRSHFVFMDDFKGFSSNQESFKELIRLSVEVLGEMGLDVGADKCAVLKVVRGKVSNMEGVNITLETVIKCLEEGKSYAYLGTLQLLDPCHSEIKKQIVDKVTADANTIWQSNLSEQNKVLAHNMFVVSKTIYSFGIINWTKKELTDLDIEIRKIIAAHRGMNKHSNCERLCMLEEMQEVEDY